MSKELLKGVGIGVFDLNNIEIHEGDKIKYRDRLYKCKEFEGIVVYNRCSACFYIERGKNGEDGGASFGAGIYDLEIIGADLSDLNKKSNMVNLVDFNANTIIEVIELYKELSKTEIGLDPVTSELAITEAVRLIKVDTLEYVLRNFCINIDEI